MPPVGPSLPGIRSRCVYQSCCGPGQGHVYTEMASTGGDPCGRWPAAQDMCGPPGRDHLSSSLFLSQPHPSQGQVNSSKRIHGLCSEVAPLALPCQRAVGFGPALHCHCCTLLSPALCSHLLLQNLERFCESASRLSRSHSRLHEPLGLNRKATTEHQQLLL